jgi:hypothetical protein
MLRCSVTPSRVDADNGPIAGTKHARAVKLDKRCYTRSEQTNQYSTRSLMFSRVCVAAAGAVVWRELVRGSESCSCRLCCCGYCRCLWRISMLTIISERDGCPEELQEKVCLDQTD